MADTRIQRDYAAAVWLVVALIAILFLLWATQ